MYKNFHKFSKENVFTKTIFFFKKNICTKFSGKMYLHIFEKSVLKKIFLIFFFKIVNVYMFERYFYEKMHL